MAVATSYGAFIAGEWVLGEGGAEIEVRAPYDDALVGTVTPASEAQVDAAVAAAKAAFPAWRRTPLRTRVEICRRAFDLCMERNDEIAELIAREVGKTIREAREEMEEYTADHFRRASEDVLRYHGSVPPSTQECERHEADHGGAGADRRRGRRLAVELPGRHRRHPARVRPRARLHDGLEAVRVRAAVRQHVRPAAARRRLPAGHRQPRARPRRDRRRSS